MVLEHYPVLSQSSVLVLHEEALNSPSPLHPLLMPTWSSLGHSSASCPWSLPWLPINISCKKERGSYFNAASTQWPNVQQPPIFDMPNCSETGLCVFCRVEGEGGDMFSNDSQGWKHKVRLIKAFVWLGGDFFVLSLMVLKVVFILSVMILKSKANHLSPSGFLCHWSLFEFNLPPEGCHVCGML